MPETRGSRKRSQERSEQPTEQPRSDKRHKSASKSKRKKAEPLPARRDPTVRVTRAAALVSDAGPSLSAPEAASSRHRSGAKGVKRRDKSIASAMSGEGAPSQQASDQEGTRNRSTAEVGKALNHSNLKIMSPPASSDACSIIIHVRHGIL